MPSNLATRELTPKQQLFVEQYIANGGRLKQAAVEAGYAEPTASAEANRLMKNPLVRKAIYQEVSQRFASSAPMAVGVIEELALSAKSGMVRLLAAQDLLDRAGFKPIDRSQVMVAGDMKVSIDLT
jgi:phage terminase small subunit